MDKEKFRGIYLSSYCMNGDSINLLCTNAVRMKRVHSLWGKSGQTANDELKVLLEMKLVRLYNLHCFAVHDYY